MAAAIATVLGWLWGSRFDPVAWVIVGICLGLGFQKARIYWPLVVSALGAAFTLYSVWPWWIQTGVEPSASRIFAIMAIGFILAYSGYGLGFGTRKLTT